MLSQTTDLSPNMVEIEIILLIFTAKETLQEMTMGDQAEKEKKRVNLSMRYKSMAIQPFTHSQRKMKLGKIQADTPR